MLRIDSRFTAAALFFAFILMAFNPAFAESDKDVLKVADPMVNQLNKAMETKNFNAYMAPWDPSLKGKLTKEQFDKSCDQTSQTFGTLKSKSFDKIADYKGTKVVIWNVKYSNYSNPLYLHLIMKKINGKYYAVGHWIRTAPMK